MVPVIAARVRTAAGPVALVALMMAATLSPVSSVLAVGSAAAADPDGWTVYHGDPAGGGVASSSAPVDTASAAWTSAALDGELYGEPLVADGRVYVATEDDRVYALSTGSGAVDWSVRVGTAVPASSLPCGNIQPTVGITGTPIVDEARGELFVVADELVGGSPAHVLVGLAASSGQILTTVRVDPSGALSSALLQRTGLTLEGGQVVFGFGGNYGDCSTYRGWVVAVGETGGAPHYFAIDGAPGESRGAVWMGGAAPAVDGRGEIWVSVGNGSVVSPRGPYDDSDSVLELSAGLQLVQFFAPSDWAADNAADRDLSMEPVLLPGAVMVAGKSRTAYLLSAAHLGGIGGQQAALGSVCSDDVEGGAATAGTVVYLPCTAGVVAVDAASSPPGIRKLWSSDAGGGPPILAGGLVWTISRGGTLYGLDPASGAVRQQAPVAPPANDFPTPSAGDGLLLVATGDRVEAFAAATGAPTTTLPATGRSATPTSAPAAKPLDRAAAADGGLPPAGVGAIVAAVAAVLAAGAWLLLRRARARRSGPSAGA